MGHHRDTTFDVGSVFDLSDLAGSQTVSWVCIGRSPSNDQIFYLCPAIDPGVPDGIPLALSDGTERLLIPDIQISVHDWDLRSRVKRMRVVSDLGSALSRPYAANKIHDQELIQTLSDTAAQIEEILHTSNGSNEDLPSLAQCRLVQANAGSQELTFEWLADKNRRYTLIRQGKSWLLRQDYLSDDLSSRDIAISIRIGDRVIEFGDNNSGIARLKPGDVREICKGLGVDWPIGASRRKPSSWLSGIRPIGWAAAIAVLLTFSSLLREQAPPEFTVESVFLSQGTRNEESIPTTAIVEIDAADLERVLALFSEMLEGEDPAVTVTRLSDRHAVLRSDRGDQSAEALAKIIDGDVNLLRHADSIEISIRER